MFLSLMLSQIKVFYCLSKAAELWLILFLSETNQFYTGRFSVFAVPHYTLRDKSSWQLTHILLLRYPWLLWHTRKDNFSQEILL